MSTTVPGHSTGSLSYLERTFHVQERGSSLRTEILAGATTFLTMAYIVFVNPGILSEAGMPPSVAS
jgi:AGZA family xanthine/uracil permease-like MFS transporter